MWPVLKSDVEIWFNTCTKCQNNNLKKQSYKNIPLHESTVMPCNTTHVGVLVPWKAFFKDSDGTNLNKTISYITEADKSTSWPDTYTFSTGLVLILAVF